MRKASLAKGSAAKGGKAKGSAKDKVRGGGSGVSARERGRRTFCCIGPLRLPERGPREFLEWRPSLAGTGPNPVESAQIRPNPGLTWPTPISADLDPESTQVVPKWADCRQELGRDPPVSAPLGVRAIRFGQTRAELDHEFAEFSRFRLDLAQTWPQLGRTAPSLA